MYMIISGSKTVSQQFDSDHETSLLISSTIDQFLRRLSFVSIQCTMESLRFEVLWELIVEILSSACHAVYDLSKVKEW
ncbi:hypothetical protein F0562_030356 [Nyssa sinensis]|uniref:Uncharacterized protein n=1 Tax=Nyssa sinensis TaxID=561372 RepID=A0A5J5AWP3_9ASTE|nr:hypothetical protein F0562_030356 [Nyssa sinensis]